MKASLSMRKYAEYKKYALYIRRNWKLWGCGILLPALFGTATNIYFARRLQEYVAKIAEQQASFEAVSKMLILTLPVLLLFSFIDNMGEYVLSLFLVSTENAMREEFYNGIVCTPLKNLQKFSQGELITRYNTDVEQSALIVSHDIFGVVYPLIAGTGYMIAVLSADFKIGLLMGLLGAVVILLNSVFLRRMKRARAEILRAKETYVSDCSDAIRGKMSIRQYSAQEMMDKKIGEAANRLYKKECRAVRLEALKALTSDAVADGCIYLLTPLACVMAVRGYIGVSVVLFIHQLCRCFIQYTRNFAASFIRFSEHSLSFKRVNTVIALENEAAEERDDRRGIALKDFAVTFQNVCVTYESRAVLKDASFSVSSGECIGIVGESGSGKSTLIRALMQLTAYQGDIYIGGENCKDIPLYQLRKCIAYSPEHNDLFPATVYDNIRYGNLNATELEISHAAEQAGISSAHRESFLKRTVGENGDQLSGGQKQRVSIARALLKDAPIYIFDEPTAALDADTETKILNTILKLKHEGKCILLITHKKSTLCIADRIVCVENGKVSEV